MMELAGKALVFVIASAILVLDALVPLLGLWFYEVGPAWVKGGPAAVFASCFLLMILLTVSGVHLMIELFGCDNKKK